MAEWVDFREVKARVTFRQVFDHYALLDGAEEDDKGEIAIHCPFHDGRSRTLKANDTKHGFNCFSPDCDKKGNVIDLVAAMEGFSFRSAALLLQGLFMKPLDTGAAEVVHEAARSSDASAATEDSLAPENPDTTPPAHSGKGYMTEVEATLRELLKDGTETALIKWVKEELLASYRRGIEKGKGEA